MTFTAYEVRVGSGGSLTLTSSPSEGTNHIYYNMDGEGEARVEGGGAYNWEQNSLLALSPDMKSTYTATTPCRVMVIHGPTSDLPHPKTPAFCTLRDIITTDRDMDWHHGRSRMFLIRADGYNISIHNTVASAGYSSALQYRNNWEAACCVRGSLRYPWGEGQEAGYTQEGVEGGDGWLILMDQHDAHRLDVHE